MLPKFNYYLGLFMINKCFKLVIFIALLHGKLFAWDMVSNLHFGTWNGLSVYIPLAKMQEPFDLKKFWRVREY